ncbi:hypothetical protein [uncultured Desulfovibrio sp.]|uniref:AfsR/SARP family transcriptional regulator n=1 Tax=uncultured Desulfovibrio sp. TaxID=167968 RepID=UPI0025FAD560|nr:hypothetical protein [uncultured Desulfovibrio sp.]
MPFWAAAKTTALPCAPPAGPTRRCAPLFARTFSLQCFGGFRLFRRGVPRRLSNRKAAELLAYLACCSGGPCGKPKLARLLWPNVFPEQARDSLYKICRYLRRQQAAGDVPLLRISRGEISLDLTDCVTDVALFDRCLAARDDPQRWREGVALYRGALLEDDGFAWAVPWEAYYENGLLELLHRLVADAERTQHVRQADYYRKLLRFWRPGRASAL